MTSPTAAVVPRSYATSLIHQVDDPGLTIDVLIKQCRLLQGDALPGFMWEPADAVARAGLKGLDSGRRVVIPGVANRAAASMAHLTPHAALLPILNRAHPAT